MRHALWSPAARDDLGRIDHFNARYDSDFAEKVARAAIAAGDFLAEFPLAGPVVEFEDRKWHVPGTDYILIYRVVSDGVRIVRVHHGREDWRRLP